MCVWTQACVCSSMCVCIFLQAQTLGASRLRPCCLKWSSVVLIELNEWSRTPLHLSDPAAPTLPPKSRLRRPTHRPPSKEQLANGWPIKQARATSPHLCATLVRADSVTSTERDAERWKPSRNVYAHACLCVRACVCGLGVAVTTQWPWHYPCWGLWLCLWPPTPLL